MEKFSGEDSWTVNVHLALVLEPLVLRRLIRDFLFEKCATCQSLLSGGISSDHRRA